MHLLSASLFDKVELLVWTFLSTHHGPAFFASPLYHKYIQFVYISKVRPLSLPPALPLSSLVLPLLHVVLRIFVPPSPRLSIPPSLPPTFSPSDPETCQRRRFRPLPHPWPGGLRTSAWVQALSDGQVICDEGHEQAPCQSPPVRCVRDLFSLPPSLPPSPPPSFTPSHHSLTPSLLPLLSFPTSPPFTRLPPETLCWNERRVLSLVDSPFVVCLRYAFTSREDLFLILDLMRGGDLAFHLDKRGRFSMDEAR